MNANRAAQIMIGSVSLIIVFHICILIKLIPYDVTWGGRLENDQEMYVFETVSIILNLLLLLAVYIKREPESTILPMKLVNGILWGFLILFALNTVGNLFAKTILEKSFSILTGAFVVLLWIILRKPRPKESV